MELLEHSAAVKARVLAEERPDQRASQHDLHARIKQTGT
jgi:hypothetical protein